ncbi:MAG TPA: YjbF family lipoprotein [Thermohalobaculum sp.]|nr:YjbF family lipoprotein [Thermohalobaculum sp.]
MRRLVRIALFLGLAAGLAACTSGRENTFARLGGLAKLSLTGPEEAPPAPELTRAQLDQIPFATIALSFDGGPRSYLVPLADNGGYLTYLDSNARGLVMLGGAVTATKGLGNDLRAIRHHPDDPVAYPGPLADWPDWLYRDYQYTQRDGEEFSITMACVFERLARETIEIAEIEFDVVRVGETCTNAVRQVTNTYWVEEDTGFVWKSEQWLGPRLFQATVEIIRPYSG